MKVGAILAGLVIAVSAVAGTYWLTRSDASSSPGASPTKTSQQDEPVPAKEGPHPKAVIAEPTHEFGVMKMGDSDRHAFVIRNEGEAPLKLGTPQTTCQCTVPEVEAHEIPPGGEGTITLEWTPTGATEEFDKGAMIATNDPKMREITLRVVGKVEDLVKIEPGTVWNAGEISGDKSIEITGAVYSRLVDDLEVSVGKIDEEMLSAEVSEMTADQLAETEAKSGSAVKVKILPGMPVGKFDKEILLKTNLEGEEQEEIKITVTGTRHGPIQILPMPGTKWAPEALALDLGRFPAAKGHAGSVSMFVNGLEADQELVFESVEAAPDRVELELKRDESFKAEGRQRYTLKFTVPPGGAATYRGRGSVKVNVKTNHPEAKSMKFYVQFVATPS